jgi:hypothetical protein
MISMGQVIKLRDERELFTDDVGGYSSQKSESPKKTAKVYNFLDEWAKRRYPAYAKAIEAWKYATGEERIPSGAEIAKSIYRKHIETPAKKKVRDIVAKRGKYALEKFDEAIIRNAVDNYINGISEVPFQEKERIVYEGKDVWGFQDGRKIEYLPAYKIKKTLGQQYDIIRNELGLEKAQLDKALEHYVKVHEFAEKRLMEYSGESRLSEERHGWLQAKVEKYLTAAENDAAKIVGKVAYRIDSLRDDEFGLSIKKNRLAA